MPFKKIISHKNIINILQSSINNKSLAHAYLFVGPQNIGKNTVAKEFAKALNCNDSNKLDGDNCGICISCKKTDQDIHPDIHIIQPENDSIKIEVIREIEKQASLKPFEGNKKVYIIDEAEKILQQSANAFLKTLEEPPQNTIFILLTSELKAILPTIISRCQVIRFTLIDEQTIIDYIKTKYNFDDEKALSLTRLVDGRIGALQNLLEDNKKEKRNEILDFLGGLPNKSYLEILLYIDLLISDRQKIEFFINICLCWYRDILMIYANREQSIVNIDYKKSLENNVKYYLPKNLLKINRTLEKTKFFIKRNLNQRLVLEILLLEIKDNEVLNYV